MTDDGDDLVELPAWVKRVKPHAPPAKRHRTLADRIREATGEDDLDEVIDVAAIERDIERLRTDV